MITTIQNRFLEEAVDVGALTFGQFSLKSGRVSPYFFNMGKFSNGRSMQVLAECYSSVILSQFSEFDILFGPAYKGIPIVTATSIALAEKLEFPVPFAFDRKEAKTHGEGGKLVGAELNGKIIVMDDVITAGTAIRGAIDALMAHSGTQVAGCLLALDRQEVGQSGLSAVQELENQYNIPVRSIVKLDDLISFVSSRASLEGHLSAVLAYRNQFGIPK